MGANIFGERFQLMSFGESHGPALGAVIDGCPAGVPFDEVLLARELSRRRPGQSHLTTARQETDAPEILSGIFDGFTLGTPIAVLVRNTNQRSQDYQNVGDRAGHADDVWKVKFGHSDPRGGGRASGRETLCRVIGGAFAQMMLRVAHPHSKVVAYTSQVGDLALTRADRTRIEDLGVSDIDAFPARFPSESADEAEKRILEARARGDSLGGFAEVRLRGVPAGLGQPVFRKFKSDLAAAFLSVGAVNGVEFGAGFASANVPGTQFHADADGSVYGGVRGGITTGEEISFRVSFKPTSSILDVAKRGRHDPFIVPRAVPVLEAMAWLVLADHVLWSRTDRASQNGEAP